MSAPARPLDGVRVADFGQLTAGANTSAMLADLGADVIKIESATYMDLFRHWTGGGEAGWWNASPQFHFTNRNKRGAAIDLKHPEGRRIAFELVARCDLVVENYSRGVLDRLGLGYAAVAARNPRIVYASITSQGETGPNRLHRTYGSTLDAMGGLAALTGYPGEAPAISGGDFNYPDQVVSLLAAGLVITGLREARRTGRGGHLDIAQREVVSFLLGEEIGAASIGVGGEAAPRGNAEAGLRLQDCFRVADGGWIALTVSDQQDEARLRAALGLAGGPLGTLVAERLSAMTRDAAVAALREAGIAAAPVNDGAALLDAPTLLGGSLVRGPDARLYKGMPYDMPDVPFAIARGAPDLGADTDEILGTLLDLDAPSIAALRDAGVTDTQPKEAA